MSGPLDAALHAVGLGGLAHHERVDRAARACMIDVATGRPQGQAADGGEIQVRSQLTHEASDEQPGLVMQGRAAQVDVVVGLFARRQRDPSMHDREFADGAASRSRCSLTARRRRGRAANAVRADAARRAGARRVATRVVPAAAVPADDRGRPTGRRGRRIGVNGS